MKITKELRPAIENAKQDHKLSLAGQSKFGEIVQKQDNKLQMEQLHKLMSQIEGQGERLSKSRNFRDLAKYKSLVKNFVKQAVEFGMNLKQSHSWTSSGHSQTLRTVEQIDRTLVELTDEIVKKEQGTIEILGKIGEIKGLLINLYM
jgi:uncharacterized protein YaaR (DUF327 family)